MKPYSWDAKYYARHSSAQQAWASELIAKLDLEGDERILDIGCADGKVTAEIATHVLDGSVVGVDNSSSMIELAQNSFPSTEYHNLHFELADATKLRFKQQFDVVFSNAALHWVRDHRQVLKSIYRILKPTGRILLQMGGKGNAATIISVLDKIIEEGDWKQSFKDFGFPYGFHSPTDYEWWLKEAGFQPARVELISMVKHRMSCAWSLKNH